MKTKFHFLSVLLLLLWGGFLPFTGRAQYTLNGSATQNSCRCYTLTTDQLSQSGSVWNNNRIDLNQSFDFNFQVFLGCNDGGADGIAFVLQPISTSVGTLGGGMGYSGVAPAAAVTLDTYQNSSPDNDPFYDHIAIQLNGDLNHLTANTITPLTPISASSNNVEDCQNHTLRVVWDAVLRTLTVYFDGQLRLTATRDLVNTIFGGNPLVYWGFTGATGGLSNLQQFCTVLTPRFRFLPNQKKCVNEPIPFFDSTSSFGGLMKWYWNFGDGSPIDSVNLNPVHTYTTPGNYVVTYRVIARDGCEETFIQPVEIGGKPVAGFTYSATCTNSVVQFTDTSTVSYGIVNQWFWNLDNAGLTSTSPNPSTTYATAGPKLIRFVVKTQFGCESDTLRVPLVIRDRPSTAFSFTDSVCVGTPTSFFDQSTLSDGPVNYWAWTYDDSTGTALLPNPTHVFSSPGNHAVTLFTSGTQSSACAGDTITRTVFVADKPVAGIRSLIPCERQSVTVRDSSYVRDGVPIVRYWWSLGNGVFSNQTDPVHVFPASGPLVVLHVVTNQRGCVSDTLRVTLDVADKPQVRFGFSTPRCRDSSLRFTDSSAVQSGTVAQWNWIGAGGTFGTTPQVTGYFPFGNQQAGLAVTSSLGCFSDTLYRPFRLIREPLIRLGFNDTCKYDPVRFFAEESGTAFGIASWHWNFGDGQGSGQPNPSHVYTANGAYPASLYAISSEGCSSDTFRRTVNIYGTDAFAGRDTIAAAGQPVRLQASGGVSYQWTPLTGLVGAATANPVATNTQDMTYYLEAYTPAGCKSYDMVKISIYKGPDIYMPTAFTPNNDGLNDVLTPLLVGMGRFYRFSVYNRYGQLLFSTSQSGKGWDGRFKGQWQPTGTYVWYISADDFRGKPIQRKGSVFLVR